MSSDVMHVPFCNLRDCPVPSEPREVMETFGTNTRYQWVEYVPTRYTGRRKVPLVVKLHGGGGSGPKTYRTTTWAALAEREGFICIFPTATQSRSWIAEDAADKRDIDYIVRITKHVMAKYNIDASRVYLTGMSLGDMMSYAVAGEAGDIFAALASFGGPTPPALAAKRPRKHALPVIQIRGEADVLGPGVDYRSFDETFRVKEPYMKYNRDAWIERNGCSRVPVLTMLGDHSISLYKGALGDLVFIETKGMGHLEAAWAPEFIWREFFDCFARVDGKIVRRRPSEVLSRPSQMMAVAAGASAVYKNGEVTWMCRDDRSAKAVIGRQEEGDASFMGRYYKECVWWQDVVMAPVQLLTTLFGAEVRVEGEKAFVTLPGDVKKEYVFTAGSMYVEMNGSMRSLPCGAWAQDGRFYLPVQQVAEMFGYQAQTLEQVVFISPRPFKIGRFTACMMRDLLQ